MPSIVEGRVPVFYERRRVGDLIVVEGGAEFRYEPEWLALNGAFPVSVRMPLDGASPVPADVMTPWLANLLPEGNPLRVLRSRSGLSADDVLGLVQEVGRDTAGALSIGVPEGCDGSEVKFLADDGELERVISELPAKPFLLGEDGVSMSLAGAQDKLPVFVEGRGRIGIPINGHPSNQILKPDHLHRDESRRLEGAVQNEAFCMVLARLCGLPVANVSTGRAGRRSYLLVSRYDRLQNRHGAWRRIHQEDFCQALGRFPQYKYERNSHAKNAVRGPTLAQMFDILKKHSRVDSITRMLDAVIFNVLIGNVDSHAKNYSLVLRGGVQLAPLYDLMCGGPYDWVTKNLPQSIGGKVRAKHLKIRHWRREAEACGLSPAGVVQRVSELAKLIPQHLDEAVEHVAAMPAGGHYVLDECRKSVIDLCRSTRANMAEPDDAADDYEEAIDQRPKLSS